MYKPIHSDFIIHWTGKKDIDDKDGSDELYIRRLKDILKYGLWMARDEKPEKLDINGRVLEKPLMVKTCFTELKLSESRMHAEKYGRLGIGVKRYFLFDRLGSPMVYVQHETQNLFFPPYSDWLVKSQEGKHLLCFFKHMCSSKDHPLVYDNYNESEWRIVYSESIRKLLLDEKREDVVSLFKDPKDPEDIERHEYYKQLKGNKKPEYLLPLDPWLAIIIYPNLQVKKKSIEDTEIRKRLKEIANRSHVTGCPERTHPPIELDLDACHNF